MQEELRLHGSSSDPNLLDDACKTYELCLVQIFTLIAISPRLLKYVFGNPLVMQEAEYLNEFDRL